MLRRFYAIAVGHEAVSHIFIDLVGQQDTDALDFGILEIETVDMCACRGQVGAPGSTRVFRRPRLRPTGFRPLLPQIALVPDFPSVKLLAGQARSLTKIKRRRFRLWTGKI